MKRILLLLSFTGLLAFTAGAQDLDLERVKNGKSLFRANCASCHHPVKKMTGPALAGAIERWDEAGDFAGKTGQEWMYSWIRNWNEPVAAGYEYAVTMKDFDASAMNAFTNLSDADIADIMLYADNSTSINPPPIAEAADETANAGDGFPMDTLLMILVGLLLVVALVLGRVSHVLDRLLKEKNNEAVPASVPFWKNKKLRTLVTIILIVFVGVTIADNAINLGRQQGYAPTQPIKFSHELHAGTHNIDCQYCHFTAGKSKHANIPSADVCMNCHKVVQEGPKYGTEEIAKIYAATGWDVDAQDYIHEPKPIEWVRIHNLPDHVYFNHAQHVNAGNIECQTCHGPVEEMEVMEQFAPLSMGWCVNCHRETGIQFTQNDYYGIYEKYHEELSNGDISKVTVEDIGGTDCQKCHY